MTKINAVIVPVTPFQQNCTLLWCEVTKRAVVIDPGGDLPKVERAITPQNRHPRSDFAVTHNAPQCCGRVRSSARTGGLGETVWRRAP